jgi:hypothetical protein
MVWNFAVDPVGRVAIIFAKIFLPEVSLKI